MSEENKEFSVLPKVLPKVRSAVTCGVGDSFIQGLEHVEDLYYFDGPLISLFHDPNAEKEGAPEEGLWLFYWCDTDDVFVNRWIVSAVTQEQVDAVKANRLPLHALLLSQEPFITCYLADINGEGDFARLWLVRKEHIPEEYLPEPDCLLYLEEEGKNV